MAIIITIVMSICIIVIVIIINFIVIIINPTSYKCNECYLCSSDRRADLHVHRGGACQYKDVPDWSVTVGRPEDPKIYRKFTFKL